MGRDQAVRLAQRQRHPVAGLDPRRPQGGHPARGVLQQLATRLSPAHLSVWLQPFKDRSAAVAAETLPKNLCQSHAPSVYHTPPARKRRGRKPAQIAGNNQSCNKMCVSGRALL